MPSHSVISSPSLTLFIDLSLVQSSRIPFKIFRQWRSLTVLSVQDLQGLYFSCTYSVFILLQSSCALHIIFFFNTYSTFEYCNSPLTITLSALSLFSEFFLFSSHYDSCFSFSRVLFFSVYLKRLLSRVCTLQHVIFTSDLIFTLFLICALNQTMLLI